MSIFVIAYNFVNNNDQSMFLTRSLESSPLIRFIFYCYNQSITKSFQYCLVAKTNWFKCSVSQLQQRILKLILLRHSSTYFIQNLY